MPNESGMEYGGDYDFAEPPPSGMKPGSCICRQPCGRTCHVISFDDSGILVSDPGIWRGKISWKTFRSKWKML